MAEKSFCRAERRAGRSNSLRQWLRGFDSTLKVPLPICQAAVVEEQIMISAVAEIDIPSTLAALDRLEECLRIWRTARGFFIGQQWR